MTIVQPIQAAIQVPSGKLVISGRGFVENYIGTRLERWPKVQRTSCGRLAEQKEKMLAFAELGLFFGYMGNSTPDVFQQGDTLYLGNNDRDIKKENKKKIPGKKRGQLVTDGDSYFAADHDDYQSKGGKTDQRWAHQRPLIIPVTPGRYVISHYYSITENHPYAELYATIARSDSPVSNQSYPEEALEDRLGSLFPNMKNHEIIVREPFESYNLTISFENPFVVVDVDLTPEQMANHEYLGTLVNSLRQQKIDENTRQEEKLRKFAEEHPEEIRRLVQDVRAFLDTHKYGRY